MGVQNQVKRAKNPENDAKFGLVVGKGLYVEAGLHGKGRWRCVLLAYIHIYPICRHVYI